MARTQPVLTFINIAYHCNGVGGAPFHVVLFSDRDEGQMVATVFEEPGNVAVLNTNSLQQGDIGFGSNSWRGDLYEPQLRAAIKRQEEGG